MTATSSIMTRRYLAHLATVGALLSSILCAHVATAQQADKPAAPDKPSVVQPAAPPTEPEPEQPAATEVVAQPEESPQQAAASKSGALPAQPVPRSEPRDLTFGQQQAYQKLLEDGASDLQYGSFKDARTNYARAHDLQPGSQTERGLGRVAMELKDYVTAVGHFEAVLAATWDGLPEAEKTEVQGWLEECRGHTGSFVLTTDPVDARVAVDGTYTTLEGGGLILSIGSHVLRGSAPGRDSAEIKVEVAGGERGAPLLLALPVTSDVIPLASEPTARREVFEADAGGQTGGGGMLSKWWFWTAVGVAVAGGVTTAVLLSDPGTEVEPSRVDRDVAGRIVALELP